jgi:hypothetical protein
VFKPLFLSLLLITSYTYTKKGTFSGSKKSKSKRAMITPKKKA